MRHVSLDLTLTDAEAKALISALHQHYQRVPEGSTALCDLALALDDAMRTQPENILFSEHDTKTVLEQRKICSFCDGTGEGAAYWSDCIECGGTGKVE